MFDDVHYSLMIASGVLFLILIFILNSLLFKPLLKFMDERASNIASNLSKMKKDSEEIASYEEELSHIHERAVNKAATLRNNIIEEAGEEAAKKLALKQIHLDKELKIFNEELKEEKIRLYKELMKDLAVYKQSYKETLKHI